MKISSKGRYALRLMIDLALYGSGGFTSLKDVSARQGISVKYLEQIVIQLSRAGFLKSARGAGGGYRLAAPPSDYTAGDILRAVEGSLAPVACLEDSVNECPRYGQCSTVHFWEGLNQVINQYVDSFTLQDLADRCRTGCNFTI